MAGGAEVHLHRIFGILASQGHSVKLLTTAFAGAPSSEIVDGIEVERFGNDLTYQFLVLGRVRRADREFRPDIIVEDINKLPFYSALVSSTPKFLLFHHLWGRSIFREASFPIAFPVWLHEQAMRFFYSHLPASAVSPSTIDELRELGFPSERLHLVYNGTEQDWFAQDPIPPSDKPDQLLWLGRMRRYKGVWVALEAMKIVKQSYPQIKLCFAGSGPEIDAMKSKVTEWGLTDQVQILGRVSDADKTRLLRQSKALIQSSFKEGWGLTVIEAAACGTPAIASRVAGLRDSVIDQKTGILFDAGDANQLAIAIIRLCTDSDLLDAYSGAALDHARSFSWENSAAQTLELLQNTINAAH